MFKQEINFFLFPLYAKTKKRGGIIPEFTRKSYRGPGLFVKTAGIPMTTYNYVFPIVHFRYGEVLRGWQFWPLVGYEEMLPSQHMNEWDEVENVAGHKKFFFLWPIFFNTYLNVGTENPEHYQSVLPLYSYMRSPLRDSTTICTVVPAAPRSSMWRSIAWM